MSNPLRWAIGWNAMSERLDRRKQRTRAALIGAAQRFLSTGVTSISIQEITTAADVGFGSFYNHFESKDELFDAALTATLDAWTSMLETVVAGVEDPALIFAMSFRMTGRLQRNNPELVRVLLHSGTSVLSRDGGLRARALDDLDLGVARGRFGIDDTGLTVMLVGGALLGLLQLLDSDPDLDGAELSDVAAERVLVMLGLSADEAAALSRTPLPPIPELVPSL